MPAIYFGKQNIMKVVTKMKFVNINKISTVDYPKKIVATLFTAGCNFRCSYCHNFDLLDSDIKPMLEEEEIMKYLLKRKGILDGICITGGEPSLWDDELLEFIKRVKNIMGNEYLVKIDTNGSNPVFVENAAEIVDFIAMDLKSLNYDDFSRVTMETLAKSIENVKKSKDYEIRFTMFPEYIREEDFEKLAQMVKGVKKAAIQQFNPKYVYKDEARNVPLYKNDVLQQFEGILKKYVNEVEIRGI